MLILSWGSITYKEEKENRVWIQPRLFFLLLVLPVSGEGADFRRLKCQSETSVKVKEEHSTSPSKCSLILNVNIELCEIRGWGIYSLTGFWFHAHYYLISYFSYESWVLLLLFLAFDHYVPQSSYPKSLNKYYITTEDGGKSCVAVGCTEYWNIALGSAA